MSIIRTKLRRNRLRGLREDRADFVVTEEGYKYCYDADPKIPDRSVSIMYTPLNRRAISFSADSAYVSAEGRLSVYKFNGNYYCCFDYDSFSEYNERVTGTRSDGDK